MALVGPYRVSLVVVTVAVTAVSLVPPLYHRWWWWDVVTHSMVSGVLAAWGRTFDLPFRWAWPLFVAAMLAWEWLELWSPLLYQPNKLDVLKDLTVNVVAFGTVWTLLSLGQLDGTGLLRSLPGREI